MTVFNVTAFNGEVPKVSPRLLPDDMAAKAVSCKFDSGQLRPWRTAGFVQALPLSGALSVYLYAGSHWFCWSSDVDVVRSQIAGDTTERVYFSGDDYPRVTRNDVATGAGVLPAVSYRLGVPQPEELTWQVIGEEGGLVARESSYVYTLVTAWGEEGPPSMPTELVTVKGAQTVQITFPSLPSGNYNFGAGALRRLYRTVAGNYGADFQLVAEVPIGVGTFHDDIADKDVAENEVLSTDEWIGPPDDDADKYPTGALRGLMALPNGGMAGFTGNILCLSVPYVPYAWPSKYRYSITSDIVGIVNTGSGIVIGTTGKPYIAAGYDPLSVTLVELDIQQACVSKRSMVDMGEYALYASPDGLVSASGSQVQLYSDALMSREQWQALNPSSIVAFHYDGRYFGFYDNGTEKAGFIFDPKGGKNAFVSLNMYAVGGHYDPATDSLYLILEDRSLVRFDDPGAPKSAYLWQSKEFVSRIPVNMGALRVEAREYPVTATVFADGSEVCSDVITDDMPVRLPSGFMARSWSVALAGSVDVDGFSLAECVGELM